MDSRHKNDKYSTCIQMGGLNKHRKSLCQKKKNPARHEITAEMDTRSLMLPLLNAPT